MQTTLLGFAIAIILALLAALVGPLLIDWDSYRGELEARATQLIGLDVRVTGAIDARLLPTPSLVLQGVRLGRADQTVRVRALRLEFALGALVRGDLRVADARLEGPELAAGLDAAGHLAWPVPKIGFDPELVAVERLKIRDGRAVLTDAASGSRLVLDKLEFNGELRSLVGPIKGEGSFLIGGQHYPYRVSTSRISEDTGAKVRLAIDPIDRPLRAEADVVISVDRDLPRFEGSVSFARPTGKGPAGAQAVTVEPWRIASRIKGDARAAVLEQIDLQYGPEDRAIKLKGNANLAFGPQPEIIGVLTSPQIDLDRVLALPEATRRRPLAAVKTVTEALAGMLALPIPTALSIGIESVTLGGATLARVGADLTTGPDGLDIKALELRAPGLTQLRLSGRLGTTATGGVQFEGLTRIEASDPRALVAWLTERPDAQTVAAGPMRLGGDVTLGSDAIAVERLKLELDRMTVDGRFAYAWASDNRPARLDAALTAPDIDLDRVHALAKAMFGDAAFDWPREGALSLKIARAAVAGVEAKDADVNMRIDANGLEVERLAIADFGGAALAIKGRIDTRAQSPRGAMTLDLDARSLGGVVAIIEKLAPQAAEQMRRSVIGLTPVALRATLALDPGAGESTNAKFKIDGRAGSVRLALGGDVGAGNDAFKVDNLKALRAAKVNLNARLDADDGAALVELVALDRFIAADKRPGRLTLTAKGPLDGELAVDGQLTAGTLAVAAGGTILVSDRTVSSAALTLKVANANVRSPRPLAGRPLDVLPVSVNARLALSEGTLRFTDVTGTVVGTRVGGRLAIGMRQQPITVEGDIEIGAVDLSVAIAAALGIPAQSLVTGTTTLASATSNANLNTTTASAASLWPSEPFEQGVRGLRGQVAVRSARVTLTPKLAARDIRGVLQFGDAELALQSIEGDVAGGRLAGELSFLRRAEGVAARSRIQLAGANAADLLPGDGLLSGRLTLDVNVEGTGMSPSALIGSLAGSGTFTLEKGRVVRLDPAAFDAVMRAVDLGLPIDATRVRDRMDAALASGVLTFALAEGALAINAGRARLTNTTVQAQGADLAVSGSVNLADGVLDGRLTLLGAAGTGALASTRPEIAISLKGPSDAPRRSIDVAALTSWLALRAVEQQSKKLDLLEGREQPPAAPAALPAGEAAIAPAQSAPVPGAPTPSAPVQDAPVQNAPPQSAPAAESPASSPVGSETDPTRPRPAARTEPATPVAPSTPKPKSSSVAHPPPLPPPVDIRPPASSRAPPKPATATAPPAPPAPPAPRSLREILFGN
ncbi:MAG TPA: AsmA family protein [Xanthobacteraceae bacterium]|nr:AsmA family protein [Xanthobacteraceae bacterium]